MRPRLRQAALPAAVAIALLCLQQARAQEYPAGSVAVVEIVGVAPLDGLGIDRRLLPYPVQQAGAEAIRKAQAENLADFMARNLNGVNVNETSGSLFQNDITFRGFRASPVLGSAQGISVYLDGVRVNEPFGDVVNWDMLPEAAVGKVLLVPGSNPMYGLNTLGGALALSTKDGLADPGLEFGLSAGSGARRRADLSYGVRDADRRHAFVAATLFDDGGWRDHSRGRLANLFLKVGQSSGATDWHVSLLGGRSALRGNGVLPDGLYRQARRAVYTHPDTTDNRLLQGGLGASHRFGARRTLTGTLYARNSRRDGVNGDIGEDYADYVEDCGDGFLGDGGALDPAECRLTRAEGAALHTAQLNTSSTRQSGQGASVNLGVDAGAHRINAGITFDRNSIGFAQFERPGSLTAQRGVLADPAHEPQAGSSVTGRSRAWGLYASDTCTLARGTHLSAAARFNHAVVVNTLSNAWGPQPREAFSYTRLNPALGLAHAVGGALTLLANVAQSNRVPTVIELGCADPAQPCRLPVALQADPYLKQVLTRTVEAGARWQARGAGAALSVYRSVNRDDILFMSSGTTRAGYFANVGRTRHQGVDFSANGQSGRLAARVSYNYLDAVFASEATIFTGARRVEVGPGTRIAGLPRHTAKIGLDFALNPQLTLGADAQAVSSMVSQGNEDGLREDLEDGEAARVADWRVHGYALLNLRAGVKVGANWEFFARLNNVFDRRYATFGTVASDLFPNGRLVRPHLAPEQAQHARFVAPGAPRSFAAGLRYRY
ncbi:TonB-dependent receptor [Massilia glaciei]|uniref:TonB-dependent receptor n=1 Tax=Massilia glaciei TaxID=1524097 RepID=A0A2U2I784_9BURK|nr:TonB-dependent receptor [Massilia glaciei]PWF55616.1 TonB-dependent receptor [Massilia glaciei]